MSEDQQEVTPQCLQGEGFLQQCVRPLRIRVAVPEAHTPFGVGLLGIMTRFVSFPVLAPS